MFIISTIIMLLGVVIFYVVINQESSLPEDVFFQFTRSESAAIISVRELPDLKVLLNVNISVNDIDHSVMSYDSKTKTYYIKVSNKLKRDGDLTSALQEAVGNYSTPHPDEEHLFIRDLLHIRAVVTGQCDVDTHPNIKDRVKEIHRYVKYYLKHTL